MAATITGDQTGTVGLINAKTSVASTSGTSIDITGIPSGVKRITVMFSGVSGSGTANPLIQLGTVSGVETTSYQASSSRVTSAVNSADFTAGFALNGSSAANIYSGSLIFSNFSGNTWVAQGVFTLTAGTVFSAGTKTLSGTLDRVRLTWSNGTDTFDAGSINILYE